MKILIVDDNPTNRKLLKLTLESQGHLVVEAGDGAEALERLGQKDVEVVISDILMPNMDGYRLCFEARQTPGLEKLPVILYSSTYVTPSDRDLALRFGASAFLEKPATAEQLEEAIGDVLRRPVSSVPGKPGEDLGVLKQYNERLVSKIEEKNVELQTRTDELAASEEKFRQLAEHIQEVFFLTNADQSQVIYVSPAYEVIWGRPCQDLYADARQWIASIHPEDQQRILDDVTAATPTRDAFSFEYRIVRPDKTVRWIHARGFPIRDASGQVYRFAGIAEDMTERNSLHAQLLQAQKMEAVGRLAGGIAHDFNNLLTAINGYSSLALRRLDQRDPSYREIEEVRKAGERAAGLTRQLLAFSRKQILQPRVLSLNAIVLDMERLLGRLLGEDVGLHTALGEDLGSVKVDPGQMEQVIVNLAVNARDAMPKGGKLTLETANVVLDESYADNHPEATPGRHVMIAVSDTGTGMTAEVQAHLFEPFFTTKETGKGTGLGLATVHGIVKQSGGSVTAYSELGRGTTFKVYLPRVDIAPDPIDKVDHRWEQLRGSETILLVEDEEIVRTLAKTVLKQAGYTVLEAGRGEEALVIAQEHSGPIHLLLTDVVMPGISGQDLLGRILGLRKDVRILYMSGYTGAAMLQEGVFGADTPFLGKPFVPEQLLAKVREVLKA